MRLLMPPSPPSPVVVSITDTREPKALFVNEDKPLIARLLFSSSTVFSSSSRPNGGVITCNRRSFSLTRVDASAKVTDLLCDRDDDGCFVVTAFVLSSPSPRVSVSTVTARKGCMNFWRRRRERCGKKRAKNKKCVTIDRDRDGLSLSLNFFHTFFSYILNMIQ